MKMVIIEPYRLLGVPQRDRQIPSGLHKRSLFPVREFHSHLAATAA